MKTVIFVSDCLEIAEVHEDSVTIKYSNNTDFAGVHYSNGKPEFLLRLKAQFYRERSPEENESDTDSEGIVNKLSSSTKLQRLIEIDPAPYHIHQIAKLALQHNSIEIDEEQWKKEETYDMSLLNQFYPMESATCWLTSRSSTQFNVFG